MQGDENILKVLNVYVRNSTLNIESPKDFNWHDVKPINITIYATNLNNIAVGGIVTIKDMDVDSSSLELKVGGMANCTFSGKVKTFTMNFGGRAIINAKDLIADEVYLNTAGKNYITVHANETLQINGVGNNDIFYYGNPKNFENNSLGWNNITQLK